MENMISVPLHEYEELVRDSEKLRIITEMAMSTREPRIERTDVLRVAGYKDINIKSEKRFGEPIAPAQRIRPDKTDSMPSVSMTISNALKEAYIDGAFPEPIAIEMKRQIREKSR